MTNEPTRCCDDIAIWPDETWATMEDVWNGHYAWKSDDYEIVSYLETERLIALGIYDEGPD